MVSLLLQAAMCYVHVAALVAEYLWRKGESGDIGIILISFPFNYIILTFYFIWLLTYL